MRQPRSTAGVFIGRVTAAAQRRCPLHHPGMKAVPAQPPGPGGPGDAGAGGQDVPIGVHSPEPFRALPRSARQRRMVPGVDFQLAGTGHRRLRQHRCPAPPSWAQSMVPLALAISSGSLLSMNETAGTREGRRRQKPGHTRHRAFLADARVRRAAREEKDRVMNIQGSRRVGADGPRAAPDDDGTYRFARIYQGLLARSAGATGEIMPW